MDEKAKKLNQALREPLQELAPPNRDRIFEVGLLLSFVAKELGKDTPDLKRVSKQMANTARSLMRKDRPSPQAESAQVEKFWPQRR